MKTQGELIKILLITGIIISILSACAGPAGMQGPAGESITGASVNSAGHLVLTLSNGQTIDAGTVQSSAAITMGDLFSLIQPVMVRVDVTGSGFQASGSGIIVRNDGYILTNAHVIDSAESIMITLSNDQQYPAAVTSSDINIDLAILKLSGSPSNLPVAVLGSASDIIIGGVIIAAGFPLGPDLPGPASFTQGIVSAVRTLDGQKYVQTDVAINPGNSGGALINRSNAKVIGITTSRLLPRGQNVVGIGLAIPIDVIQTYIQNNLK